MIELLTLRIGVWSIRIKLLACIDVVEEYTGGCFKDLRKFVSYPSFLSVGCDKLLLVSIGFIAASFDDIAGHENPV